MGPTALAIRTLFGFNILLRYNLYTIQPTKRYNSIAFSIFAELNDHNHNLMNIFVPSQKKPYVL